MTPRPALLTLIALAALAAPAGAERDQPARDHRVNLRVGAASTDANGRPTICLEIGWLARATVEACGTGSGLLHTDAGGEMAHFRAEWRVLQTAAAAGTGRVQVGAGFAELEVGEDRPGFQFGSPDAARTAVAGPEGAVSVQWLHGLGRRFEAVANLTCGVAWFSGAAELIVPQSRWQPFASLELGIGW